MKRWLAGAGAIVIAGGLSGIALAADAAGTTRTGTLIKGCFNSRTGALRVVTPNHPSCGSERKISWDARGPAGNGYAFKTTAGSLNALGVAEADGPRATKAGTYFVNVSAQLNIAAYTKGGSGFCALDLANTAQIFVFEIFSAWDYPGPAANLGNSYPFASSGMVHVTAKRVRYRFVLACFDNSFHTVPVKSAIWIVSPVSATSSAAVGADRVSRIGPAGFRPAPARTP